jgi:dihydrofolate reductase
MGKVRFIVSMSLDGFVAGPNQSEEHGLGEGGEALHDWLVPLAAWRRAHGLEGGEENASTRIAAELEASAGAVVMGRNMFGPVRGPWGDEAWTGWWGEEPPFHAPVFVLTHHEREPLPLKGGTTFHFVTGGIGEALERAQEAAGEGDVLIAGGAATIQQALAAGAVDEFVVSIVPLLLGDGARLLEGLGDPPPRLELVESLFAPGVTHHRYRVLR